MIETPKKYKTLIINKLKLRQRLKIETFNNCSREIGKIQVKLIH